MLDKLPHGSVDNHAALIVQANLSCVKKRQPYGIDIAPRLYDTVEFQLAAIAVQDYIDARIHIAISNLSVRRYIAEPLRWITSLEVIALTRQWIEALQEYFTVRSQQSYVQAACQSPFTARNQSDLILSEVPQ
jgi:hypothetical protein